MTIRTVKDATRAAALSVGKTGLRRLGAAHPAFLRSLMDGVRSEPENDRADEDFLRDLYNRLLGRPIDFDGLSQFLDWLAHGMSRADVVLALAVSDEYRARCRQPEPDALPRPDSPRARRPESYRYDPDRCLWTVAVDSDEGFDWLEAAILREGYYERPGVWSLVVDTDKRLSAEIIALLSRGRVLEVGCSSGAVLQCLHSQGLSFEGVDISAYAIERGSEYVKPHIHHGDLLAIELSSDFDIGFGLDIFEHLNPNRLAAYLNRIRACLLPGGLLYANIPVFGHDEVFGEIQPFYLPEWDVDAAAGRCFHTLHVDNDGYPVNGHLIWADSRWWVSQFMTAGFVRCPALEMALHEKYDDWLSVNDRFRQAIYVFSVGDCPDETMLLERIHRYESPILQEFAEVIRSSRSAR